jgi:hypothetical protein
MNNLKKYGYEAIETIKGMEEIDPAVIKAFREGFATQAFAGLDEEMKTNVMAALESVSDEAMITLGVQYGRGSITAQEVIDLATEIDKIPREHQTKIMIAYGNGSLSSEGLKFLSENMNEIAKLDGKQVNFLVDISVLGQESMAQALAMMATLSSATAGPAEKTGAAMKLDQLKKQAAESRKLIADFIEEYNRSPEDTVIEGLINDSDIYDFYLMWRNDIDDVLSAINFFDEIPSEEKVYSLYDYIIVGTKRAVREVISLMEG